MTNIGDFTYPHSRIGDYGPRDYPYWPSHFPEPNPRWVPGNAVNPYEELKKRLEKTAKDLRIESLENEVKALKERIKELEQPAKWPW